MHEKNLEKSQILRKNKDMVLEIKKNGEQIVNVSSNSRAIYEEMLEELRIIRERN